jgi:protein-tyrosine phosphatase
MEGATSMTDQASVDQGRRRMPLTGAVNFRDLGGYVTVDGKVTAWRRLFRSDSLADLTDDDIPQIDALGLQRIFDLRAPEERRIRPSRMPASERTQVHAPGFYLNRTDVLLEIVNQNAVSVDNVVEVLKDIYRQALIKDIDAFREAMDLFIKSSNFPALVHCTSGKDRTGIFIMLVLTIIGVPRETIIYDYMLTNDYQRDIAFMLGPQANPLAVRAVKSARRDFLSTTFHAIDDVWGGEERFLSRGLELSEAQRRELKTQLLEG